MSMASLSSPRFGFYYSPDTLHYTQQDFETWLPPLQRLGARWLALMAPSERAIPQSFIEGLLAAGIQPFVHFPLGAEGGLLHPPPVDVLRVLVPVYARWGVRYVVFYDRPNNRAPWSPAEWAQSDLVERFVDLFLPLATLACDEGLVPFLPPLVPGGDFWDLSFLRLVLRALVRRRATALLERLGVCAEAWLEGRPLEWGAGGPERWPQARPYFTPAGAQDHRGFHIFEWYLALCEEELGSRLPLFLLRMGHSFQGKPPFGGGASEACAEQGGSAGVEDLVAMARCLSQPEGGENALPPQVVGGCFWLLTAAGQPHFRAQAWFDEQAQPSPSAKAFFRFLARASDELLTSGGSLESEAPPPSSTSTDDGGATAAAVDASPQPAFPKGGTGDQQSARAPKGVDVAEPEPNPVSAKPSSVGEGFPPKTIDHYLLLPLYAWGAADWDLQLIQPLLQKEHPTVGFSLAEARAARRVTVVGGPGAISPQALAMLRAAGCQVEHLREDGTLVAP